MKKADFANLPNELKEELNKITFLPMDERDAQVKLLGAKPIRNTIVKILVEEEVERRTTLVQNAIKKATELSKEYSKIKPDQPGRYNKDMVQEPDYYSSEAGAKKLKLLTEIKVLVTAINAAMAEKDSDFGPLEKIIK